MPVTFSPTVDAAKKFAQIAYVWNVWQNCINRWLPNKVDWVRIRLKDTTRFQNRLDIRALSILKIPHTKAKPKKANTFTLAEFHWFVLGVPALWVVQISLNRGNS